MNLLRSVLALAIVTTIGCKRAPQPPLARPIKVVIAERLPTKMLGGRRPESQRKSKDSPVYVDGKPIGVWKISELPQRLKPHPHKLLDGREVPRYRVLEAIEAMGVDASKIKAVHLYGGRSRASMLPGSELLKHREDLTFSFSGGDTGKPRIHWPDSGIKVNTTIDSPSVVAVYVDKEPPRWDPHEREFFFEEGKPIEGTPYVDKEDAVKGTRVYVDGQFLGGLKRKMLPNSVLMPGADQAHPRFSIAAWLKEMGAPEQVNGVEVLVGERVILRFDARSWAAEKPSFSFAIPRHSQGKMFAFPPLEDEAMKAASGKEGEGTKLTCIQIFVKERATTRPLRPLREVLETLEAGSTDPQPDNETAGNPGAKGAAQGVQSPEDE
jgi:hypothetical protein